MPDHPRAWHPPEYDVADVHAVRALETGNANPDQQKRALGWIIRNGCGTYDLSFRPESDRETSFAEGRRFVGLMIVKLLNMPANVLAQMARGDQ